MENRGLSISPLLVSDVGFSEYELFSLALLDDILYGLSH